MAHDNERRQNDESRTTDNVVSGEMLETLRRILVHGRRRWKSLILAEGLGLAIAAPLGFLWLAFLLDNVFHLSIAGRVAASLLFFAVVILLLVRLIRNWRRASFTEDQVALAIEQRTPGGVENRLINAVQIAREPESDMDQAVIEENYRFLKQMQLQQSTESRPAMLRLAAAAVVLAAGLAFWSASREQFANAATRIFLPFADITPIYRTTLAVSPGDVETVLGEPVTIRIHIDGHVPDDLLLLFSRGGEQTSKRIPVRQGRDVETTFESVRRTITYAVRGGDYTTPTYKITVPLPLEMKRLTATLDFPDYTDLPNREIQQTEGDIEALDATRADLEFVLNQPAESAWMVLESAAGTNTSSTGPPLHRVRMSRTSADTYGATLLFTNAGAYRLEALLADGDTISSRSYRLNVTEDTPPELLLNGVQQESDVMIDAVLPLEVNASDDYGLSEVGIFYRHVENGPDDTPSDAPQNGGWNPLRTWDVKPHAPTYSAPLPLLVGTLEAVEGDSIELAARGKDIDPSKQDYWTTGTRYAVTVTSPGAELQILYEQILETEGELETMINRHKALEGQIAGWVQKLDPMSGLRWDDEKNLKQLSAGMNEQARTQSQLRETGARVSREMVRQAGETLRLAVGMLTDTEMVRSIRILEKVASRDTPQEKRSALADARLTQQRIIRSLNEILDKYVQFRRDWELSHMLGFTRMMAERQERMAEASGSYAALDDTVMNEVQKRAISLRQDKLLYLAGLAQDAYTGMGQREDTVGALLAAAFRNAAGAFDESGLKTNMQAAKEHLAGGAWTLAEPPQRSASSALLDIYRNVLATQKQAARDALAALEELAESNAEAQKELEKLKAGTSENLIAFQDGLDLEEIIHLHEVLQDLDKKSELNPEKVVEDYYFEDEWREAVSKPNYAIVDVNTLKLGDTPSGDGKSYPNSSDREANEAVTSIQEKFEDLVGDLLEEADDLRKDYETYNINTSWGCADPGTVGKAAGDLNGTGATSTTGNQKPPTMNVGGASRAGRLGARSHGLVVGDEMINRRGRDQAQEGQMELADQGGEMKETMSSDPQQDASTGIGGKVIKSAQTHFSLKDAGEWEDKIVEKLRAPQKKNQIVERKGKPLSADVAEMMRDLQSEQEQVIERIKAIKKELDQLYLPTDHLDEIMDKLKANLDRLAEKPDAEVFREQIELLDELKSVVVVFNPPSSDFEQSLVREQVIKGRILDEPAALPIPGYEEAVSLYYEKLSGLRTVFP